MNKNNIKTIGITSIFWVIVATTIGAFLVSGHSNYERGFSTGYAQATKALQQK